MSPYHLATREVPAMAALVMATRAVTLLPHPSEGTSREAVLAAVRAAPRYLRLLESWRWSGPLWRAGVISAAADGEPACASLPTVYQDIQRERDLAELRGLTQRARAIEDEGGPDRFLDALSGDLIRGGPDPGIAVPINAALERFSAKHGLVLARGPVTSVAQRAETRMGTKLFSFGLPILSRCGGGRVLLLRQDLEKPLERLRVRVAESLATGTDSGVMEAVRGYTAAFSEWVADGNARGDDEQGHRVQTAYAGVAAMRMPVDAVLESSRAAVRSLGSGGFVRRASTLDEAMPTLIVREMGVRPVGAE